MRIQRLPKHLTRQMTVKSLRIQSRGKSVKEKKKEILSTDRMVRKRADTIVTLALAMAMVKVEEKSSAAAARKRR